MKFHSDAQAVIVALQANGGMYIDDHNRSAGEQPAQWFGIYESNGKKHAFIGYNTQLFCINACSLAEDGRVHQSTMSVGGNVRMDLYKHDHEFAVDQFNLSCKDNTFDKTANISLWHVNIKPKLDPEMRVHFDSTPVAK